MGVKSLADAHAEVYEGTIRFEIRSPSAQKEGGVHDLHSYTRKLYAWPLRPTSTLVTIHDLHLPVTVVTAQPLLILILLLCRRQFALAVVIIVLLIVF